MRRTVQNLLAVARGELGYHEKDSSSNLDEKNASNDGSGNYTKYARDLAEAGYYQASKQGFEWCDVFVDWCFYKLCGKNGDLAQEMTCQTGPYGAGCEYSAQYYKNQNRYFTENPMPGDQIFFGDFDHTGIVEKVEDGRVYTIEGNTTNHVGEISYALTDSYITGFGRPFYDDSCDCGEIRNGDVVTILPGAVFWNGESIAPWLLKKEWIVYGDPVGERAVINHSVDGENAIMSPISTDYLVRKGMVRSGISPEKLYNTVEELPATARVTIRKLLTREYLLGSPDKLQLTDSMVRILMILDRAGVFDGK